MKIILPAKDIPDGAKVQKIKGNIIYTLKHNINIYSKDNLHTKIEMENVLYLVEATKAYIIGIPETTELIWLTDRQELLDYLEACDCSC